MTIKDGATVIYDWNQRYPAGTPVKALLQDGTVVQAVTNSGAWIDTGIGADGPKIEILLRRAGLAETDSGRRQLPLERVHVLAPLPILKDWNNRYPAGTPVTYTLDDGRMVETTTRSEAWRLADGSAVILVDGQSGAVAFERVDLREVAKDETERDIERLRSELHSARPRIEMLEAQVKGAKESVGSIRAAFRTSKTNSDAVYKERDMCVALIARMALGLGYRVWLGQHPNADWEDDWRTIVFIDLPTGQVSWHIHDSEREWFLRDLHYNSDLIWDSHDTAEKYHRVLEYRPPTSVEQKTDATQEQKWEEYLRSLGADETLPAKQRQCVLDTWLRIVKAEPCVRKPTAGLDEKGNFYFGWNPGDRSLDIEIDQEGKLDWFFINHATGVRAEGSSTTESGYLEFLPDALASAAQRSKPPITREVGAMLLRAAYRDGPPDERWLCVWDRAIELLPCERPRPGVDTVAKAMEDAAHREPLRFDEQRHPWRAAARAAIDVCCGPEPDADGFRTCQFCGCNTNAHVRACCERGREQDSPGDSQPHGQGAMSSGADARQRPSGTTESGRPGSDEQNGNPKECTSDGSPARQAGVIDSCFAEAPGAFRRYLQIVDELVSRRAAQGTLSDDEEERFATALSECRSHMTEQDQERIQSYIQPYPLAAQYERRLVQYVTENDRLKNQVTELQARMTAMVEEHRSARALQQQTADQFAQLRRATVTRCESVWFRIKDWTATDWACALAGEVGEVCDAATKLKRGDGTVQAVADELGDVLAYADLLAASLDLDLWQTVCEKFNAVSERWRSPIRLPANKG
jgi:NTP pyrophosphatase (non-canonical NTP hydrolase)